MKYRYTNIRVRHADGTLAEVADCELDVKFPDGYDHLRSTDSPIADALIADLKECGVHAEQVYYTADCADTGNQEERVLLRMGANHGRIA